MEPKINYQYTYFIHPFIINDGKYEKYILKMLKEKDCELKTFEKVKDSKIYEYFLPKTREFLFSSFSFSDEQTKKLKELPLEEKAAELSKYDCNIFEYTLKKDIQGKVDSKEGIFFNIQKIEVICFKTGISFLLIKTNIEDGISFSNLLNFNYKFRDIAKEGGLDKYDKIRMQTNSFESPETFKEFIRNITGTNIEESKLNINTERFLTYSYLCIDQEAWNASSKFEKINHHFLKYSMILPADDSTILKEEKIQDLPKWKYVNLGISKLGVMLFSSSADMNNYTVLPAEYEEQYLYTYIMILYKKIYLKRISENFKVRKNVKKARKEFIKFTKNLLTQEITEDKAGTAFSKEIIKALELEELYEKIKIKYEVLYKESHIELGYKVNIALILVIVALIVAIITNCHRWRGILAINKILLDFLVFKMYYYLRFL